MLVTTCILCSPRSSPSAQRCSAHPSRATWSPQTVFIPLTAWQLLATSQQNRSSRGRYNNRTPTPISQGHLRHNSNNSSTRVLCKIPLHNRGFLRQQCRGWRQQCKLRINKPRSNSPPRQWQMRGVTAQCALLQVRVTMAAMLVTCLC